MAFAAAGAVALALLVGTTSGAAAAGEECVDLASEDVAFGAPLLVSCQIEPSTIC